MRAAPLAFVDVETTGLNPALGDRVCEIAVVLVDGDDETGTISTLINPLRAISPGAYSVNHISASMLAGQPTFSLLAPDILAALEDRILVAHNARFDIGFLRSEFQLAGIAAPDWPAIDTLALSRRHLRLRGYSLSSVASSIGCRVPGHRALADVRTTIEVWRHIRDYHLPPESTVADLLTARWEPRWTPVIAAEPAVWASEPRGTVPPRLLTAIRSGHTLWLQYLDGKGQTTRRLVSPRDVVEEDSVVYLVAYCYLRQDQRTFRIDRIAAWEIASDAPDTPRG